MSSYRDNDRPREKKSWREIDKQRDSSQRRDRDRPAGGLQQNTTAYEKYKKDLEKLWSNGGKMITSADAPASMPEPLRAVVKKPSEEQQKEREVREALRKAAGPAEVKKAVEEYLALKTALPNDLELLSKAMSSPVEAHQVAALRGLAEREDLAQSASARLLKTRVQTVLLTASDEETRTLAATVKGKLG
ncbi:MAG: hypothetical protein AB2A00_35710 [Myxococcota bacterium]